MPPATPPRPASAEREPTVEQASALMRSKPFVGLLVLSAIAGIVVSLAAWCFLEGIFQLQRIVFDPPPERSSAISGGLPLWYSRRSRHRRADRRVRDRAPARPGRARSGRTACPRLATRLDRSPCPGILLAALAHHRVRDGVGPGGPADRTWLRPGACSRVRLSSTRGTRPRKR